MRTLINQSLHGVSRAIPAKSDAHRLLIAAALGDRPCAIGHAGPISADVSATIRCLGAMGAKISVGQDEISVSPIADTTGRPHLNFGESATTARLLLPIASALFEGFTAEGEGNLPNRPLKPLLQALSENGTLFQTPSDTAALPLRAEGKLKTSDFSIAGDISSQMISGLLLALPLLGGGRISLKTPPVSFPYVEMTLRTLGTFGVAVRQTKGAFPVFESEASAYHTPKKQQVEGDWSAAAFLLVGGSLGGDVTVTGLDVTSCQGDRRILEILRQSGAGVEINEESVRVFGQTAKPFCCDLKDIPDLAPILAVRAAAAVGESRFTSCARLKTKESDRQNGIVRLIRSLGGWAEEAGDELVIRGNGFLQGGVADCAADHRLVMAAAIASAICKTAVTLPHEACVAKSDPDFFTRLTELQK